MGCAEVSDKDLPLLLCFFDPDNASQKEYCLRLKDNFQHDKTIKYEIKGVKDKPFAVQLKIKNDIYDIQKEFNDSEEEMNKALNEMYKKLNEIK